MAVHHRQSEQKENRFGWDSPWTLWLVGGVIVLAGLAAYANSFSGEFIFDDLASIPHNPTIEHWYRLRTVLSPPSEGETVSGRPILNLSLALNYALSGTHVWSYHLTNLVIHLLNGLLLLGILRRTFLLPACEEKFGRAALPLAGAIALLWIVHPLTTEAVTYIVQRAESLAAMFYLLVFYAVIRGESANRLAWYGLAVIACWLGMGTKEIVVTVPVMLLLYDRTLLAGSFRQALRQRWKLYLGLASSWALSAVLVVHTGLLTKTYDRELKVTDPWSYARMQPIAILYYLKSVLWPHPLCLDWGWPVAKTWFEVWVPMLIVALLLAATIWGLYRSDGYIRGKWGLLGAWFFLILAPSSSIVPLMQMICEHRMYLPLVAAITGLVVIAYLLGQRWIVRGRQTVGLGLVILAAIALGTTTFYRNRDYQSRQSIWMDTIHKASNNPFAYYNLGVAILEDGGFDESIKLFKQTLLVDPQFYRAYNNWGAALLSQGQPLEAIEHFKHALSIKPEYYQAQNNWGRALLNLGRLPEAIAHLQEAIRIKPEFAGAQYDWGNVLLVERRPAEAIEHFQQAIQLQPDYAKAYNNWGSALMSLGRPREAIPQFEAAVRIAPNFPLARVNLCMALVQTGRIKEASEQGWELARQMPDNPQLMQKIAWLLATHETAEESNGDEAVKLAEKVCRLDGRKNYIYLDTLAAAYAAAGRFDEAIAAAIEAWRLAQAAGQSANAEEIHLRLQFYRDRKPYREPAGQ